jgi:chromosome segregation ATPase
MSRDPYCPRCGVVENIHSGVYCSRLSESEKLNATLRETIHGLRAELEQARAVIRNTAETVQAFREQAEKARADWHAAENELWLGELREKIEKLREQRDRAIEVARKLFDLDDEEWACCGGVISELTAEISKEKEGK